MVALRDMLNYIDFEMEIVDGKDEFEGEKVIRLIDKQGANLGNVHDDQFPIDSDFIPMILDRLEPYWNDYIIEGLAKDVGLPTDASYEDIYNANVKSGDPEREEMEYLYALIHPEKSCMCNKFKIFSAF